MDIELRIGIVLNYKKAEKDKDELFCTENYDWLKGIDRKHIIKSKGRTCVPADVAIGAYLENNYPDTPDFKIVIDYITPDEISLARFKQNCIVFIVIFDLLECFHLSKVKFKKFKDVLKIQTLGSRGI